MQKQLHDGRQGGSSNRTFMELKCPCSSPPIAPSVGSNRTFMELKLGMSLVL